MSACKALKRHDTLYEIVKRILEIAIPLLFPFKSFFMARGASEWQATRVYGCPGSVSKIRLLGDWQHSTRIAFVEFYNAESAKLALGCSGALLGKDSTTESCLPFTVVLLVYWSVSGTAVLATFLGNCFREACWQIRDPSLLLCSIVHAKIYSKDSKA